MLMKVINFHFIFHLLEIKEEKLVEYTDGLVRELKRTSLIAAFGK
jgi:hypothetical protein